MNAGARASADSFFMSQAGQLIYSSSFEC
jgi:hypothetical protein